MVTQKIHHLRATQGTRVSSAGPILVRDKSGALAAQRRRKLTISGEKLFSHRAQQRGCAEWETGDRSEVSA